MKFLRTRKQRGFTLIEMVVVLALIAAGIGFIISRAATANQTSKVQAEVSNLQTITTKVKSTFAARPNYSGATTAFLLAQGAFPTSMINGGTVTNGWGGTVTVAAGAGNTSVDITSGAVPTASCIELVAASSRNFNEVTVGATKTMNGATVADLTAVQTACSAAATVSIIFNAS